jgi:hypothetical protein
MTAATRLDDVIKHVYPDPNKLVYPAKAFHFREVTCEEQRCPRNPSENGNVQDVEL